MLNAAVAAFYYLRVVVYMFMRDSTSDAPALRHGALLWGGLAAAIGADDPARAVPDRAARRGRRGRQRDRAEDRQLGTIPSPGERAGRASRRASRPARPLSGS